MRKIIVHILALPLLVFAVVWSLMSLPFVLFLFLPMSLWLSLIDWVKGDGYLDNPLEIPFDALTMGFQMWRETVE